MRRIIPLLAALFGATTPVAAAEPAPPPRPVVTLDQLDPANIPAEERFGGLPKDVVAVLGSSRGRHAGSATCAAVSPDGKLIASGGEDNLIRLWDARTLCPIAVLKGHVEPPAHLAFAPNGKWLLSAAGLYANTDDPVVRVWAVDGAKSRLAAAGKPHASKKVLHLQIVRDGQELLTICPKGEVRSWDLTAEPPVEKVLFRVDTGDRKPEWWGVDSAEFTADGRTLCVHAHGKVGNAYHSWLELWDVAAGKRRPTPPWQWPELQYFPFRLAADGKTLAFGLVAQGEGQQLPLRYVPDGTMTAVGKVDQPRRFVVWDLTGEQPKQAGTIPFDHTSVIRPTAGRRGITVSPAVGPTVTIHIWSTEGANRVSAGALTLPRWGPGQFRSPVGSQCLSADGSVLTAVDGNRVRAWDLTDRGPVERATDGQPAWVASAVAFGPDNRSVIAAGEGLARWNLGGGAPEITLAGQRGSSWDTHRYAFSGDARRVVRVTEAWSDPNPVRVLDALTGRVAHTLPRLVPGDLENPSLVAPTAIALNAGGTVLAQCVLLVRREGPVGVGTVRVWDLSGDSPRLTARLAVADNLFTAVAISPDGRSVAAESVRLATDPSRVAEVAIRVWDVSRDEPAVVARIESAKVEGLAVFAVPPAVLAFTPDGKALAVGRVGEEQVQVWDLTPKPRARWTATVKGGIRALVFTPDARLLGAGADGLSLWDSAGKVVARWPELAGTPAFAIAPDGRHLAAVNPNGTVFILRLPSGPEIAPHPGPTGRQIVERVEKAYADCKTYRDRGTVVAEYTGPDGKKEGADDKPRTFTTAFQRGGAFRFEFRNPNPLPGEKTKNGFTEVVWAKGDEVKTWPEREWAAGGPGKSSKALFGPSVFTPATECVPLFAPLLLLPPDRGRFLPFADAAERLADERVGAADCYRVRCPAEMPNLEDGSKLLMTLTYWIDRRSYLIRRVRWEMVSADGLHRAVATIDYDPAVGMDLDPVELEFRPPKKP